ncbi:hypothetical protein AKJ52_01055 [candidate division MSBL1 archaeon SCGC-AAA382C18]|uniref:SSD domain-containing protein n=1 Tax=candidate division MSBL1 archaeon SCGC-AAA382C18 TaxID=1698281 RepID=A0A133VKT1_9EURY|nr:hypothetical protein AKJ52_01055 [candidate division MSBL1 archaeon SCGC-AAA382C18]
MFDEIIESSEKRPYVIILIVVLISAGMVYGTSQIQTSTDMEDFLPKDMTSVKVTNIVENQTGGTINELILVKGNDLTSAESFRNIVEIHNSLENNPELENYTLRIQSYAKTVLKPEIDNYGSLTDAELEKRIKILLQNPKIKEYVSNFLSKNDNYTIITILVNSDLEYDKLVNKTGDLHQFTEKLDKNYENLTLKNGGSLSMEKETQGMMDRDNKILIPAAIIVVIIILYLAFRRISDTFLPFLVLLLGAFWMVGTMGLLGITFSMVYVALVPIILGVGIDYTIHMLNRFYEERGKGLSVDKSAVRSVRTVGVAVALTAITTIIGFISFGVSDMPPIRNFGLLAGAGVFYIFALSTTMLPAILVIRGNGEGRERDSSGGGGVEKIGKLLSKIEAWSENYRNIILSGVGIVTIVCIISSFGLTTTMSYDAFLPRDTESVRTMETIEKQFGVQGMDVYVMASGDIQSPKNLRLIDDLETSVKSDKRSDNLIGTPKSVLDLIKRSVPGGIPDDRDKVELVIQKLREQNPQEIKRLLFDHKVALIYFPIQAEGSDETDLGVQIIRDHVENFSEKTGENLSFSLEGDPAVGGAPSIISDILGSILPNMRNSIILAIVLVIIVLGLVFRSPWIGLIGSIPVILALFWEFGAIRALGWSFDVMNMMVSALAIGLGVDFSIHMTHRFVEEWNNNGKSPEKAMSIAVQNVGRALIAAASTTIGVFAILSLSRMPPISKFGQLAGLVIFFALVSALVVLPIVLLTYAKWKGKSEGQETK